MKLIAINKINGEGYFQNSNGELKQISFPYTPNFIRDANNSEISNSIIFYGFEVASNEYSSLVELIDYLRAAQISLIKERGIEKKLEGIEIDDLITFANEDVLMRLCDQIEYDLIPNNKIFGIRHLLKLMSKTAKENNFEYVYKRIVSLTDLVLTDQTKMLDKYSKIFGFTFQEFGVAKIFEACEKYSERGNIFSSCS